MRALNSSGLTAMNNAIMPPTANPTSVPAATPRQSIFSSLVVISISQRHGEPYTLLGQLEQYQTISVRIDAICNTAGEIIGFAK
jgi:hypothetical protein